MKCPYCGNEMTMGYVQCGDGVRWTFNLQPVATLSILKKESSSFANGASDNSRACPCFPIFVRFKCGTKLRIFV